MKISGGYVFTMPYVRKLELEVRIFQGNLCWLLTVFFFLIYFLRRSALNEWKLMKYKQISTFSCPS